MIQHHLQLYNLREEKKSLQLITIEMSIVQRKKQQQTRAGVYETLCFQHMLVSKDNLETRCQGQKRGIIQSNIYRILPKVNQVIYTVDTICVPTNMILAQILLQMFCWQGSIGLQSILKKREIIQPNIYRILPKVNQVIYTLDTICVSNIMILEQAVLQIFCWQGPLWVKCLSLIRGIIQ